MKLSPFFFFFSACILSYAQEVHVFTKGLAVADCHHYGREAVVVDELAYQLYTGALEKPVVDGTLFTGEDSAPRVWKEIAVDTTGGFRGQALQNGYIYLTYTSGSARLALLNISGNSMVYFNGEPHGGDIYGDGWLYLPVRIKPGINELLIRCGNFSRWRGVRARLVFPEKPVTLRTEDTTLPHIVLGEAPAPLTGAVVVVNGSERSIPNLSMSATLNGISVTTSLPGIPPLSIRKVPFRFDPSGVKEEGDQHCVIRLLQGSSVLDEKDITVSAVRSDDHHSYTFISDIDGSLQYYSVAPQSGDNDEDPALFLSVHGAGVEAIGQARAYQPKDWGVLVAPTNRRPRGFNWEDWGRIDALEVLGRAVERYRPDPKRIYLTGHSMGGHGTWYLGVTYPGMWAAIAPCAGYPTLTGYGSSDGKIPEAGQTEAEETLLRASNGSDVPALATNYKDLGVYVFHGDSDRVVPVDYARQMRGILGQFHPDFSYYEYPGGSHWFGNESVDWPPIFNYFRWHTIEDAQTADAVDFSTANPSVSSSYKWVGIIQQIAPLAYSRVQLRRDRGGKTIKGSADNVALLKLRLEAFEVGDTVTVTLGSAHIHYVVDNSRVLYLAADGDGWTITGPADPAHKNDVRTGTFKEAFNHRMVFVYGTRGSAEQDKWAYDKARYDAEVWYYRGNGAVDVIPDREFSVEAVRDRGVILYGNADTNAAWKELLKGCPINVTSKRITVGESVFEGDDLAAYFTWPRENSAIALTGVVAGTGLRGMRAADANQYFAAASGFPDYMVFSLDMLKSGANAIRAAGFYDNQWKVR